MHGLIQFNSGYARYIISIVMAIWKSGRERIANKPSRPDTDNAMLD
jgi:hypothetical protein